MHNDKLLCELGLQINNGRASDLVTTSVLMLYGTTKNNKIVLLFFLNK